MKTSIIKVQFEERNYAQRFAACPARLLPRLLVAGAAGKWQVGGLKLAVQRKKTQSQEKT